MARFTGVSTANPQHENIDISAHAAGAPDAQIRWRYYDGQSELYWFVDNVVASYLDPRGVSQRDLRPACIEPAAGAGRRWRHGTGRWPIG